MTKNEFLKLSSLIKKEIDDYEKEILSKDKNCLYKNAKEIYATKFISDCFLDFDFMENIEYLSFPKKNILRNIVNFYLENHSEISESDLFDMFYFEEIRNEKIKKLYTNVEM